MKWWKPEIYTLKSLQCSFQFLKFICFERERERERERTWAGVGAEREGRRESQEGSTLSAQSPTWGQNPRTVRSWPELKPRVGHSTDWATWAPQFNLLKICQKLSSREWSCHFAFLSAAPIQKYKGMNIQDLQRHGGTLNVYYWVKRSQSDRLYTVWFCLCSILEKVKLCRL